MNTYSFSFIIKGKKYEKSCRASSYAHAIEKCANIIAEYDDVVDILGLDDWEDIQEECSRYNIVVGDLQEDIED